MRFDKGNTYGALPEGEKPLYRTPLSFKVDEDLYHRVKAIPDWQKRLREILPHWIEQWEKDLNRLE